MKKILNLFLPLILFIGLYGTSYAEIFRCTHPDGSNQFSSIPCDKDAIIENRRTNDITQLSQNFEKLAVADDLQITGGFQFNPWQAIPVGSWPDSVMVGDVTGDGLDDVVLSTTAYFDPDNDHHIFVFAQQLDGSLGQPRQYPYGANANRNGLVLVDLDGNGIQDIVVGHGSGITLFLADGQGGFSSSVITAQRSADTLSSLDVNIDGWPDLVGLSWSNGATIFYNNGNGGIATQEHLITNASGYNDQETGDLNGDGITDLAIMSGQLYATPNLTVHAHDTFGALSSPSTYFVGQNELTKGIGLGDINGDQLTDVVLSRGRNSPTHLWLYTQDTSGALTGPSTIPSYDIPESVALTDLDGDGLDDVVVLHGGWSRLGYYLQNDTELSAEQLVSIPYASHYSPQGLSMGDINNDGCTDVAIADYNHGLVTLLGSGCQTKAADLTASLSVYRRRTVTAGATFTGGTAANVAPVITVSFDLNPAKLTISAQSDDCVAVPGNYAVQYECTADAIVLGDSIAYQFSLKRLKRGPKSDVTVYVNVDSALDDPNPADNDEALSFRK